MAKALREIFGRLFKKSMKEDESNLEEGSVSKTEEPKEQKHGRNDSKNDPPFDSPCLYGCPTAKDKPGMVPECMLATFEGWEIHEL